MNLLVGITLAQMIQSLLWIALLYNSGRKISVAIGTFTTIGAVLCFLMREELTAMLEVTFGINAMDAFTVVVMQSYVLMIVAGFAACVAILASGRPSNL